MTTQPKTVEFANRVLSDWNIAMDHFFRAVERKMRDHDLTPDEVRTAMNRGYGYETGDAWDEWIGDES